MENNNTNRYVKARQKVYNLLKEHANYVDSYDEFSAFMDNNENIRKKAYDVLKQTTGYNDTFENFNRLMAPINAEPYRQRSFQTESDRVMEELTGQLQTGEPLYMRDELYPETPSKQPVTAPPSATGNPDRQPASPQDTLDSMLPNRAGTTQNTAENEQILTDSVQNLTGSVQNTPKNVQISQENESRSFPGNRYLNRVMTSQRPSDVEEALLRQEEKNKGYTQKRDAINTAANHIWNSSLKKEVDDAIGQNAEDVNKVLRGEDPSAATYVSKHGTSAAAFRPAMANAILTGHDIAKADDAQKIIDRVTRYLDEQDAKDNQGGGTGGGVDDTRARLREALMNRVYDYLVQQQVPSSTAEYVLRSMFNSTTGTFAKYLAGKSDISRQIEQQGYQQYAPSAGEEILGEAASVGLDYGLMTMTGGLGSAAGGAVLKRVTAPAVKELMASGVSRSVAQAMANRAIQQTGMKYAISSVSDAINFGALGASRSVSQQLYNGGSVDPVQFLKDTGQDMLLGGAMGIFNVANQGWTRGLQRGIGDKAGQAVGYVNSLMGRSTLMMGSSILGQWVNDPSFDIDSVNWVKEGAHAALTNIGFDVIGAAKHWSAMRGRPRIKMDDIELSSQEIEQLNKAGYEGKNAVEVLNSVIRNGNRGVDPIEGGTELATKDMNREQILQQADYKERYMGKMMEDPNIDLKTKYKMMYLMTGNVYRLPDPTGISDVTPNADGGFTVETYDMSGQTYESRKFKKYEDAEAYRKRAENSTKKAQVEGLEDLMRKSAVMDNALRLFEMVGQRYGLTREQVYNIYVAGRSGKLDPKGKETLQFGDTGASTSAYKVYTMVDNLVKNTIDMDMPKYSVDQLKARINKGYGQEEGWIDSLLKKKYHSLNETERRAVDDYVANMQAILQPERVKIGGKEEQPAAENTDQPQGPAAPEDAPAEGAAPAGEEPPAAGGGGETAPARGEQRGREMLSRGDNKEMATQTIRTRIARERLKQVGLNEAEVLRLAKMTEEERQQALEGMEENTRRLAEDYLEQYDATQGIRQALDEQTAPQRAANKELTQRIAPNGQAYIVRLGRWGDREHSRGVVVSGLDADGRPTTKNGQVIVVPLKDTMGEIDFTSFDEANAVSMKLDGKQQPQPWTSDNIRFWLDDPLDQQYTRSRVFVDQPGETVDFAADDDPKSLTRLHILGYGDNGYLVQEEGSKEQFVMSEGQYNEGRDRAARMAIEAEYAQTDAAFTAEQEAKRKQAEEAEKARLKAEEEARKQAEKEEKERLKAEEAARKQAEVEAKQREEAEKRQKKVEEDNALMKLARFPEGHPEAGKPDFEHSDPKDVIKFFTQNYGEGARYDEVSSHQRDAQKKLDEAEQRVKALRTEIENTEFDSYEDRQKAEQYLAEQEEELERLGTSRDFWDNIFSEVTKEKNTWKPSPKYKQAKERYKDSELAMQILNDLTPMSAVELAAQAFSTGTIKLLPEEFRNQTGYGKSEQKSAFRLVAEKENGGVTLGKAGELLLQESKDMKLNLLDENDPMAGANAILEALQEAPTFGKMYRMIENHRVEQAEREWLAEQRQMEEEREDYYQEVYHMSYEDYLGAMDMEKAGMKSLIAQRKKWEKTPDYAEFMRNFVATKEENNGNRPDQTIDATSDQDSEPDVPGQEPGRTGEIPSVSTEDTPGLHPEDSQKEDQSGSGPGTGIHGPRPGLPDTTGSKPTPQAEGNLTSLLNDMQSDVREHLVDAVLDAMKIQAKKAEKIELTPANWKNEFGEDSTIESPIGKVKMGANQYEKLSVKDRGEYLGMVKPTLASPDVIIEKKSPPKGAERDTKYLFVKTFIKNNGERVVHFESVTIKKGDLEISISSHEIDESVVKKEMLNGQVVYTREGLSSGSELYLAKTQEERPDLVPTSESPSAHKGTDNSSNTQEKSDKNPQNPLLDQIKQAEQDVNVNPTEGQKEAGNYKKGHVTIEGHDITIENPKGSTRSGKDQDGKEWSVTMNNSYGYIRGTEGVDGDHIDVFLSDDPTQGDIYVVDQVNPKTGQFDEHKVMYGFTSEEEAREAYLANYSEGWKGLGNITKVSKDQFKTWIDSSHRKTKPFADYALVRDQQEKEEQARQLRIKENKALNLCFGKSNEQLEEMLKTETDPEKKELIAIEQQRRKRDWEDTLEGIKEDDTDLLEYYIDERQWMMEEDGEDWESRRLVDAMIEEVERRDKAEGRTPYRQRVKEKEERTEKAVDQGYNMWTRFVKSGQVAPFLKPILKEINPEAAEKGIAALGLREMRDMVDKLRRKVDEMDTDDPWGAATHIQIGMLQGIADGMERYENARHSLRIIDPEANLPQHIRTNPEELYPAQLTTEERSTYLDTWNKYFAGTVESVHSPYGYTIESVEAPLGVGKTKDAFRKVFDMMQPKGQAFGDIETRAITNFYDPETGAVYELSVTSGDKKGKGRKLSLSRLQYDEAPKQEHPEKEPDTPPTPPTRKGNFFKQKPKTEEEKLAEAKEAARKQQQENYDKERERFMGENPKMNVFAKIMQESPTVDKALEAFKAYADRLEAEANDWLSRKYKDNKTVVEGTNKYSAGDDYAVTIGAVNERRRTNHVRALQTEMDEVKKYVEKLKRITGYQEPEAEEEAPSIEATNKARMEDLENQLAENESRQQEIQDQLDYAQEGDTIDREALQGELDRLQAEMSEMEAEYSGLKQMNAESEALRRAEEGDADIVSEPAIPSILKHIEEVKAKNQNPVVLIKEGDFYAAYKDDAELASKVLNTTLTSVTVDGEHVALTLFPVSNLDKHLPSLIRGGHRVAIVDQLEGKRVARRPKPKRQAAAKWAGDLFAKAPVESVEPSKEYGSVQYSSFGGLNPETGEFALVERQFTTTGEFGFMGTNKVKSASDVAYIFKKLEDKAIENVFVCLVKDGRPTVLHVGMGSMINSLADFSPVHAAAQKMGGVDKVYFVHNHPSGKVSCSKEDVRCLRSLEAMFDKGVVQQGIIIDTTSGLYGYFEDDIQESREVMPDKGGNHPIDVLRFDKQVFAPDFDLKKMDYITTSENVAALISSQRLGSCEKVSFLVVNNQLQVMANIHTTFNNLEDVDRLAKKIATDAPSFMGRGVVVYGDFYMDAERVNLLNSSINKYTNKSVRLMDVVRVDGLHSDNNRYVSANDEGWSVGEPDSYAEMRRQKENNEIIQKAQQDGTYMLAPNGQPSNLDERQWVEVRTKAFKDAFGDWEKASRIEKLRKSEDISIKGDEIPFSEDLKQYKKNAERFGLDNVRQTYTNEDTGVRVQVGKSGIKEVLNHDYKNPEQIQSIAAIPQIIEKSIYIDSKPNEDPEKNKDVSKYHYYVCGLKIGREDYTVRAVIAEQPNGKRYYDHKLTRIEKGALIDSLSGTTPGFNQTTSPHSESKDSRLEDILQINSSQILDENGEPMVVYHGTKSEFDTFDEKMIGTNLDYGTAGRGFYFTTDRQNAENIARNASGDGKPRVVEVYLNIRNPKAGVGTMELDGSEKAATRFTDKAKKKGFDGIEAESGHGMNKLHWYVAFDSKQIINVKPSGEDFMGMREPEADNNSLVGLHNIFEDKLESALGLGGLANPSAAIVDLDKQGHNEFGDVTLVMPSRLVDKKTGGNAGTWAADAYTPRFPRPRKSWDMKAWRQFGKDTANLPDEMGEKMRYAMNEYIEQNNAPRALAYQFLYERGEAPATVHKSSTFPASTVNALKESNLFDKNSAYEMAPKELDKLAEIYVDTYYANDKKQKFADGKTYYEVAKEMDPTQFTADGIGKGRLDHFLDAVKRAERTAGEVDQQATADRAWYELTGKGLEDEFQEWLKAKEQQYGVKQVLFAGYTASGRRKELPFTLENVSKMMKKEGRAGTEGGFSGSPGAVRAMITQKLNSLEDIRKNKDRLVTSDEFLAIKQKINERYGELAKMFAKDDYYSYDRLSDVLTSSSMKARAKQMGFNLTDDQMKQLQDFNNFLKKAPTEYFETKFERPVNFEEFAAAVVPSDMKPELKQALKDKGLNIVEYPRGDNAARLEAVKAASEEEGIRFSYRREEAPRKTGIGYKVFLLKDGKLYPPMVANPGGADTPVGLWLDADAAPVSGVSKTGRPKVKSGGKGTQGGSGQLAYRPGWHLGEIPYALQFNRANPATGERELFPRNFVWAEVEYANDIDYQDEATRYGYTPNGKYQHSLAGLPKVPVNGSYRYRTNPDPRTDEWIITGAMRVNRILTPTEVDDMVRRAGREPQPRQAGAVTDEMVEKLNELFPKRRFIGELGAKRLDEAEEATTRLGNLAVAREMEQAGKDAKAIKLATGWERGGDGKWRHEEADITLKDGMEPMTLIEDAEANYKQLDKQLNLLDINLNNLIQDVSEYPRRNRTEQQKEAVLAIRKKMDKLMKERAKVSNEQYAARTLFWDYLDGKLGTLSDFVEGKEIFIAYPELKDLPIRTIPAGDRTLGSLITNKYGRLISIELREDLKGDELRSTLAHEVQHAIQQLEGFAKGTSQEAIASVRHDKELLSRSISERVGRMGGAKLVDAEHIEESSRRIKEIAKDHKYFRMGYLLAETLEGEKAEELTRMLDEASSTMEEFDRYLGVDREVGSGGITDFDIYRRYGGEVESRNVQSRLNMTSEERLASLAKETEDVSREDQIFLNNALNSASESVSLPGRDEVSLMKEEGKKALEQQYLEMKAVFKEAKEPIIITNEADFDKYFPGEKDKYHKQVMINDFRDKNTSAVYYPVTGQIFIFADRNTVGRGRVDMYHENGHAAFGKIFNGEFFKKELIQRSQKEMKVAYPTLYNHVTDLYKNRPLQIPEERLMHLLQYTMDEAYVEGWLDELSKIGVDYGEGFENLSKMINNIIHQLNGTYDGKEENWSLYDHSGDSREDEPKNREGYQRGKVPTNLTDVRIGSRLGSGEGIYRPSRGLRPQEETLDLGEPSKFLQDGYIPDEPWRLVKSQAMDVLQKTGLGENHLQSLSEAIKKPIAVLRDKNGELTILSVLKTKDSFITVLSDLNKENGDVTVRVVPNDTEFAKRFTQGLGVFHKNRALEYLDMLEKTVGKSSDINEARYSIGIIGKDEAGQDNPASSASVLDNSSRRSIRKPQRREGESYPAYLKRLQDYQSRLDAEKRSREVENSTSNSESKVDKELNDLAEEMMQHPSPIRRQGESEEDFAARQSEYNQWAGERRPQIEQRIRELREEVAKQQAADRSEEMRDAEALYEGKTPSENAPEGTDPDRPDNVNNLTAEEAREMREDFEDKMGDAKILTTREQAKKDIYQEIIERRRYIETGNLEDTFFVEEVKKTAGSKAVLQAIPDYIEGTYKGEVTPELEAAAKKVSDWFEEVYNLMAQDGVLYDAPQIQNYVTHIWDWKRSPKEAQEKYKNYVNTLRLRSPFTKHRVIPSYAAGRDMGMVPKYDDITGIITEYGHYATETIANRRMLEFLKNFKMFVSGGKDNLPMEVDIIVPDSERDPMYSRVNHTAFEGYKVLNEVVPMIAPVFGEQRILNHQQMSTLANKLTSGIWTTSSLMKKIALSFSFFHHGALTETAVAMLKPWNAARVIGKNLVWDTLVKREIPAMTDKEATRDAVKHLVSLGATNDYSTADVQNFTTSIRKMMEDKNIPVAKQLAQLVDFLNTGSDKLLWDVIHDGYKIASFQKMAKEIRRKAQRKHWTERELNDALDEAGQLVNDTFGGLHFDILGYSPKSVRIMRALLLSPDWTLATIRQALSPFGFGRLYKDNGFWKQLVSGNPAESTRKKYGREFWLTAGIFFYALMNGLNAYFRSKDEDEQKQLADEMRKTDPEYKSPYELAYPQGMKWYDYTMPGNTLGQQTHLFTGRYEDGTESYARWGKQFRELPELFFGRDGLSFPGPMIDKLSGKANPLLATTFEFISGHSLSGWENKDMKDKKGWQKDAARLFMLTKKFLPYSIPTQEDKDFLWLDLVMPSSKGFTPGKASSFFEMALKSGDFSYVEAVYNACVMNNLDPEKFFNVAKTKIEAEAKAEQMEGIETVQDAVKAFDASTDLKQRRRLKRYIEQQTGAQDYHAVSQAEIVEKAREIVHGEDVKAQNDDKYLLRATADDVLEDYRLKKTLAGLKPYNDQYKEAQQTDAEAAARMYEEKRMYLDGYQLTSRFRTAINRLKKELNQNGADEAKVMDEIRQARAEWVKAMDELDSRNRK